MKKLTNIQVAKFSRKKLKEKVAKVNGELSTMGEDSEGIRGHNRKILESALLIRGGLVEGKSFGHLTEGEMELKKLIENNLKGEL